MDSDTTLDAPSTSSSARPGSGHTPGEPLAGNRQNRNAADAAALRKQPDAPPVKQRKPEEPPSIAPVRLRRRRSEIEVRRSAVHGKGVFACRDIAAQRIICEYRGEILTWKQADRRRTLRRSRRDDEHTFLFQISKRHVIDATSNGCRAKWINHSCTPNCQAVLIGRRVFIETLRPIAAGEELFFDYQLQLSDDAGADGSYRCRCASAGCRGTLLSPA